MPGGARSMKGEKQMIYKSIRFKADPFLYDLKFDDRITLVGGDRDRKSTRLNSSHNRESRMPSSA